MVILELIRTTSLFCRLYLLDLKLVPLGVVIHNNWTDRGRRSATFQ